MFVASSVFIMSCKRWALGEIVAVCVSLGTHSPHSAVFCSCPQELLSQEGFPSEKVTNLEKGHFMSAILRCVSAASHVVVLV